MSGDTTPVIAWVNQSGAPNTATVAEARALIRELNARHERMIAPIRAAIHAARVKCPTCQCLIIPGDTCGCCTCYGEGDCDAEPAPA